MSQQTARTVWADASFEKYATRGAYHWAEIGRNLIRHNAFTAERYRLVADRVGAGQGQRLLDYGCGDGAFLSVLAARRRGLVDVHGYDPNPLAIQYAHEALHARRIPVSLHESTSTLVAGSFDCVTCTEVIEHASAPAEMLREIAALLRPGGRLVMTTPIRLTEVPEDPNHVQEWFPTEFPALFDHRLWRVLSHEQVVPCAAAEAYFWRPPLFLRVPIFRLACNAVSIYARTNAMTWLRMRSRLFMMQIVVAERHSDTV
jgi:2-polyprenyl-3-methyl-5-hydroxy-6-metoxy-1,4-benzoquinol methylase